MLDTKVPDSWPSKLALDGFTYDRLGSFGTNHSKEWYVGWLGRDPNFSPQPYQQMAKAFRESGAYEMADYLLYAGHERERSEVTGPRWIGLSLLKITIGYGLGGGYFLALAWIAGLTLIGSFILWTSGAAAGRLGFYWCLWASFDEILPLVEFDKRHATFVNETLVGCRLAYFYVHRIAAYVLGSFIIAGLAGLTQGL